MDSEKPSDASHEWGRPNVIASVASSKFSVKSSQGDEHTRTVTAGQNMQAETPPHSSDAVRASVETKENTTSKSWRGRWRATPRE